MPKIKIFTAKNVQRYGFTDGEIDELNAEWERKASELGLEEHLPEYWQEAKRHMSEKLEGRVAESREESGNKPLDGEPIELPSLDVNLDDFDIAGENEITAVALSDEQAVVEVVPEELSELESISVDDIELEVFPEGQTVSIEEMTEEEKSAEESATVEEPELQEEDTAQELTLAAGEMAEEEKNAEEFAAPQEQDLEVKETGQEQSIPGEERAEEIVAEEKIVPVEEQKKESFFGKIIARLKKIF